MFNKDMLREVRNLYGMTRRELAEKIGLSEVDIFEFEVGHKKPTKATILQYCLLFGVREGYFSQPTRPSNFDMTTVSHL